MSRIQDKFKELHEKGERALIGYIMSGYPNEKSTVSAIRGLIKGGADIIEVGFPFSDPLADGPVIQNASTVSLNSGIKLENYFQIIKKIRKESNIPLVLMTYTNILYHQGFSKFLRQLKNVGIDGVILPDMPVEEVKSYVKEAKENNLDTIFLISPNTSNKRLKKIADNSSGFLYLVAIYGTTGMTTTVKDYTLKAIKNAKKILDGKIPIGVGFGVSTPEDVKQYVKNGADAVIVGSSFLKLIQDKPENQIEKIITKYTKSLKKATKI